MIDEEVRQAAFAHVRRLSALRNHLTAEDLQAGFHYQGERIALINPRRGIFKPRQMQHLLSIRTVFPRAENRIWYDDQRRIHEQLFAASEVVDYAFMGQDPEARDNRLLFEAMQNGTPLIYFLGIAPGRYYPAIPVFIADWNKSRLRAGIAFCVDEQPVLSAPPASVGERKYALRLAKQRLHQASFREAVVTAYGQRCAISGLPEPSLIDAAHIVADADTEFGQPVVTNGLPLTKLHHAAFDRHLIGIDPDYCIHVSEQLMGQKDGPVLESLQGLRGSKVRLPSRQRDWPDRDRLAMRFEAFQAQR